MVTIVNKKRRKGYFRGGAVLPDDPQTAEEQPPTEPVEIDLGVMPEHPVDVDLAVAQTDDDVLQRAVRAQEQAERLREPQNVGALIDALPDHSEHKKQFLRRNPDVLFDQFKAQSMARHYRDAIEAGIADDTQEIDDYILSGMREDLVARRVSHGRAALDAMMSPPQTPEDMTRHSVTQNRQAESVQQGYEAAPHVAVQRVEPAASPQPPARRSVPVSAPPSRDVPNASGARGQSTKITLSPEERDIARKSMHWLPPAEAEVEYARQKRRLADMRANGEYPERERN